MDKTSNPVGVASIFPITLTGFEMKQFSRITNDNAKLEWGMRYLLKRGQLLIIHREAKNAETATKYIEHGSQNFRTSSWKSLLEQYTHGVVHAPRDSKELALAYGNCSAALYNGGLYKDCMLDIERALNIGYPDKLKAKLYARKARCLYALNDNKMSSEVEEVVARARHWMEKMDDANKKNISNILDKLPNSDSKIKPFVEMDCGKFLPPILEANPNIIGASAAVEVKFSEQFGRHVVATRDIKAGETLFMQKPYASVIMPDFRLKYCWNCSRRIRAGVPCHECISVIYCSETCRDTAWLDYHDVECQVIAALIHDGMSRLELMILKLIAKAYKEAGSIQSLKEKLAKIDNIKDPITKCYSGNLLDTMKYASVYASSSGTKYGLQVAMKSAFILYYLASITKICGENISNLRDLLNNQSAIFLGTLIIKHYHICELNCFALVGYDDHDTMYQFGCTFNPFINLVNHSCDAMACVVTARDVGALIATQRIKKGEQIFISYIPKFWLRSVDERQAWMQQYHFKCDCKPCLENWGPHSISSFPSYKTSISGYIERLLRGLSQDSADSFMRTIPVATLPELISNLSNIMDIHQRATEYPTQEMIKLKHSITELYAHVSSLLNEN